MKTTFKSILMKLSAFFCLVVLLTLLNCQRESVSIIDESPTENLTQESDLKILLHNISLHDGSFDDFIDNGSCFSIQFPYELQIDKQVVLINDTKDINDFNAINHDGKLMALKFPVNVAKSNHEIIEVPSQELLDQLSKTCIDKGQDNDIECVDVEYPITVAAFNTKNDNITTVEINHDRDLYLLTLTTINTNRLSIQYPITLKTKEGEFINIAHNKELERVILEFAGSCDEEDL